MNSFLIVMLLSFSYIGAGVTLAPLSTHVSINLRGDRGLVAISLPQRSLPLGTRSPRCCR